MPSNAIIHGLKKLLQMLWEPHLNPSGLNVMRGKKEVKPTDSDITNQKLTDNYIIFLRVKDRK